MPIIIVEDDESVRLHLPSFRDAIRISSLEEVDKETQYGRGNNMSLAVCDLRIKENSQDENSERIHGEKAICILRERIPSRRPIILNSFDPPNYSEVHEGVLINDPDNRTNPLAIEQLIKLWYAGPESRKKLELDGKIGLMPCPNRPASMVIEKWLSDARPIFAQFLDQKNQDNIYAPLFDESQELAGHIIKLWNIYYNVFQDRGSFIKDDIRRSAGDISRQLEDLSNNDKSLDKSISMITVFNAVDKLIDSLKLEEQSMRAGQ